MLGKVPAANRSPEHKDRVLASWRNDLAICREKAATSRPAECSYDPRYRESGSAALGKLLFSMWFSADSAGPLTSSIKQGKPAPLIRLEALADTGAV